MTADPPGADPLTIDELADLTARVHWLSVRLFETVGAWVTSTADPALATHLATVSRHHGEHARWWAEHEPESVRLATADRRRALDDDVERALAALGAVTSDAGRHAALTHLVLPRLRADLAGALARLDHPDAAPFARLVRHTLLDLDADLAAGLDLALDPDPTGLPTLERLV